RSEFNSVAVVPVSPQERSRATDSETGGSHAGAAHGAGSHGKGSKAQVARSPVRERLPEPTVEFKLIDDEPPALRAVAPGTSAAQARTVPAPRRAAKRSSNRVLARDRRSPQTLEETLEILGADQLEIEQRGANGSGRKAAQPAKPPARRNSPFTKLLDRLSEKTHRGR
ncbi:MAG: hypothetical protein ACRETB_14055, partial [Steroidobacteraceae bacterium]